MGANFLLYGANGYTGRLILERALLLGMRPVLGGRNAETVGALAAAHGLQPRVFALEDASALAAALTEVPVVLHAAGPFSQTAFPMAEACIRTGTHYVDITGEIDVFERLHEMAGRARDAGVMLLPGAGFDVVPTDLLAAHLKRRLPDATRLLLAFYARGGSISRGTLTTMVENLDRGGAIRRDGRIVRVPTAWRTRTIDFGFGTRPVEATTIPWGDVATAYYSTGIPNVEVYASSTALQRRLLRATRPLQRLLGLGIVQTVLKAVVRARVTGPDETRRRTAVSLIHGMATNAEGARVVSRMRAPEGYTLTAMTAVEIVRRILDGDVEPGFQTPSLAYGADWILELENVEREDVM